MSVNLDQLAQLLDPQGLLLGEDVLARPNAAWGAGSCPARAIIRAKDTEPIGGC
jgi:hypothetical protein